LNELAERGNIRMKKWILLILMGLFLYGCGAGAKESGFWQHGTMYKNFDHLKFSWFGYKNPDAEKAKQSQEQDWWGIEVPYIPAK
jgi:hypothetical protein